MSSGSFSLLTATVSSLEENRLGLVERTDSSLSLANGAIECDHAKRRTSSGVPGEEVPDGQKVRFGHLLEDRSMHRGVEEDDISPVLPPRLTVEDIRVRTSCRSTTEEVLHEFERHSKCSNTVGRLSVEFERDWRRSFEEIPRELSRSIDEVSAR